MNRHVGPSSPWMAGCHGLLIGPPNNCNVCACVNAGIVRSCLSKAEAAAEAAVQASAKDRAPTIGSTIADTMQGLGFGAGAAGMPQQDEVSSDAPPPDELSSGPEDMQEGEVTYASDNPRTSHTLSFIKSTR